MANGERYKIFCGSLPSDCTQEDLMTVFSTYGTPTDIHLMAGKSTSGQCCAFIVYDSHDAAESAIKSLDGIYSMREDGSGPVRVSWARPQNDRGGAPPPQRTHTPAAQQVVGHAPPQHHQPVLVAPPSQRYQQHHQPVVIQPRHVGPPIGALVAPAYHAGPPSGSGRSSSVPPWHEAGHGGGGGGYHGAVPPPPPPDPGIMKQKTKLFVGNLPSDIQEEAINIVFSHYGTVTNIYIMTGKAKSGQACAFVEYSAPIEAETAVLTLHEKYEIRQGDGPILVKYAQPGSSRARPY